MQRGGAKAVRPRHVVSALVLVPRFTENVRGYAEGGSCLQHRLLGYCPKPAVESAHRTADEKSRGGGGSDRESENGRVQDRARERLCRRVGGDVHRLRQGGSPDPCRRLRQGDGGAGAEISRR